MNDYEKPIISLEQGFGHYTDIRAWLDWFIIDPRIDRKTLKEWSKS
jgi:hypothetical protein